MAPRNERPIIIVRKRKKRSHAHHGGAWKVAYADFVTAMMAFFLVMWLVGQSPQVKAAVGQYFRDPGAFEQGGRGVLPGAENGTTGGGQPSGSRTTAATPPDVAAAKKALERAAEHLRQAIQLKFADVQDRVEITVTDE